MTPERVAQAAQVLRAYADSIKDGATIPFTETWGSDKYSQEAKLDYLEAIGLSNELYDMVQRFHNKQKRTKK